MPANETSIQRSIPDPRCRWGSRGVVQRAQHSAQRGREKGNASLEAGPAASTPLQATCQSARTGKRERRRHLEDRDRARFAAPFVQTGAQGGIARRRKNRWRRYPNALPGGTDVAPVDDARFTRDQGVNHEISQSLPALRGARAGIDAHRVRSGRSRGSASKIVTLPLHKVTTFTFAQRASKQGISCRKRLASAA